MRELDYTMLGLYCIGAQLAEMLAFLGDHFIDRADHQLRGVEHRIVRGGDVAVDST